MACHATLAVLLLSLLAVASGRVLEAISDEQGTPNPVVVTQDDQEDGAAEVALPSLPTTAVAVDEGALRLPSNPCHRHLWWARYHGLTDRDGAFSGPVEARVQPAAFFPTELYSREEQAPMEAELEAVAEPDPDSRPDKDGEQKPFNGHKEALEPWKWKVETAWMFGHDVSFHDRHHLRHHHDQEEEDHHGQDKDEGTNMKLFQRFHPHAHDGDDEADEVEELARRLSKAIKGRSFSHGGRRRHHHHHGEEGGVKKWFKGLVNRF